MEKTLNITITSTDKDFTDEKVCESIFQTEKETHGRVDIEGWKETPG